VQTLIVSFRKHTLLPLDDYLYALQPTIPALARCSLHCCRVHAISRLPEVEGDKPKRKKFDNYPIGFFHIDLARCVRRKADSISSSPSTASPSSPSLNSSQGVPYRIRSVLTDNGVSSQTCRRTLKALPHASEDIFSTECAAPMASNTDSLNHPWTNGPSRTDEPNHHGSHRSAPRNSHADKTLKGLTPYEYIYTCWQKNLIDLPSTQPIKCRC
jgi:hypothetical protein